MMNILEKPVHYFFSVLLLLVGFVATASQAHLPGQIIQPVRQYAGTPYFIADWTEGEVLLNTGERATGVYLRYDGLHDRLLWLIPEEGNKQVEVDKLLVESFVLKGSEGDHLFRRTGVPMLGGPAGATIFAEVVVHGCVELLVYRRVRISDRFGQFIDENRQVRQALMLIDDPLYYLVFPGDEPRQVRPNRRALMGVAREKLSEEQYHNLDGVPGVIRNETQLSQAIDNINRVQPEFEDCD